MCYSNEVKMLLDIRRCNEETIRDKPCEYLSTPEYNDLRMFSVPSNFSVDVSRTPIVIAEQ